MTPEQVAALGPAFAAYLRNFEDGFGPDRTREHRHASCRGLLSDPPRKSVGPIAPEAGTAVRTPQEFLKDHLWDRRAPRDRLRRRVNGGPAAVPADDPGTVGPLDETSVVKKGKRTPGLQRPYCGAAGKQENRTATVHLGVARSGFKTLLDADPFLPQSWSDDRGRCREAGVADDVTYEPKWRLGLNQVCRAMGGGVAPDWPTFDGGYGRRTGFLAELGLPADPRRIGGAPKSFRCRTTRPKGKEPGPARTGRRADQRARHGPAFWDQPWRPATPKRQTLGDRVWQVKAAQVYLMRRRRATDGTYGLIVARNAATGGVKYFVSNASADAPLERLLRVAFPRWNVGHGFRVAKSGIGLGHYEGRNYTGMMRHMLLCLAAPGFVAGQADRLRGEKSGRDAGAGVPGVGPTVRGGAGEPAGDERVGAYVRSHRLSPAA
jgi:SRSO17 transposase